MTNIILQNTKFIYIIVCAPNSIIAKTVKFIKGDKYTHVGISFEENINIMYSFSRKYSYFPFIGGLMQENFREGVLSRCEFLPGIVMRIPVSNEKFIAAKNMAFTMYQNKQNYKYNVRGFIAHSVPIRANSENKFTCSEFVAHILSDNGIYKFKKPEYKIRPQEISELGFETVYEGNLLKYTIT